MRVCQSGQACYTWLPRFICLAAPVSLHLAVALNSQAHIPPPNPPHTPPLPHQGGSLSVLTYKDVTGLTPPQLALEKGHRYLGLHLLEYKRKADGGGWFGKNGKLAWLTSTQLCPFIWAYGLGVPLLFHYKVRGGKKVGWGLDEMEGRRGQRGTGKEAGGRGGKGRGVNSMQLCPFIWAYGGGGCRCCFTTR